MFPRQNWLASVLLAFRRGFCEVEVDSLGDRGFWLGESTTLDGPIGGGMTLITLSQSGSIIDLDSVSFVIKIQNKTGDRGIRIGLGRSELQIITPADARRFLEELRESKGVDVESLLKWIPLASTSIRPPAEPRAQATSPQPESVET